MLSLAVNPFNANVIYAGTDGGGVFRTTNGLNTNAAQVSWTQVGRVQTGLTNGIVRALKIDPARTNIIYAATDGGVFQSIGGGDAWVNRLNTPDVTALTLDPTDISNPANNRTLYAGTRGGGVFRSINSGSSWTRVTTGPSDPNVISLVALSRDILYVGTFGNGVFRTFNATDPSPDWSQVNNGFTSTVINTLATDGTRCTRGLSWEGSSSSLTEDRRQPSQAVPSWAHLDSLTTNVNAVDILNGFVSDIVIDSRTPSTLYAATSGDGTQKYRGQCG